MQIYDRLPGKPQEELMAHMHSDNALSFSGQTSLPRNHSLSIDGEQLSFTFVTQSPEIFAELNKLSKAAQIELGKQMLNGLGTTVIGKLPVTICRDTNYQFAPNTFAFSLRSLIFWFVVIFSFSPKVRS